jgi:hypothetical protein
MEPKGITEKKSAGHSVGFDKKEGKGAFCLWKTGNDIP